MRECAVQRDDSHPNPAVVSRDSKLTHLIECKLADAKPQRALAGLDA